MSRKGWKELLSGMRGLCRLPPARAAAAAAGCACLPLLRARRVRTQLTLADRPFFVATESATFDGARHVVVVALPMQKHPGEVARLLVALLSVLLAIGTLGVEVCGNSIEITVTVAAGEALRIG